MESHTKLYKYLDVEGGKSMLHYSNLQFTNATRLNDPFDCHPSLFNFSNVPINENNWPPVEFLKKKGITDMENLRNSAWICSLSKVYDSLLMWAYYGNHKGICIGLDMEKTDNYISKIHCGIIGPMKIEVQYRDIIEKPDYFHGAQDYFHYLLSTKADAWKHEQEVRFVLIDPIPASTANHPYFAPIGLPYKPKKRKEAIDWKEVRAYPNLGGECFDSLYLGLKMEEEEKASIIQKALRCNPHIKIFQMIIDPSAFRLIAVPIDL